MQVELNPIWSGFAKEGLDIKEKNIEFFNIRQEPFAVYGLWNYKEDYRRLPTDVAKNISNDVYSKSLAPAGARVRFATDSDVVGIRVKFNYNVVPAPHITRVAYTGFDMYIENKAGKSEFSATFKPSLDGFEGYEGIKNFNNSDMKEITIYFPIGNEIFDLEIALRKGSTLKSPRAYKNQNPIVFYGSSITHGFCVSRPGNVYSNIITRELDNDTVNLGFSGSAKGEKNLAEYIAGLKMSAFVLDYDHNAPTVEYLEKTHEAFFKIVRKSHPDIPIIMITRPVAHLSEDTLQRQNVVLKTYMNARANGDKNVYFIDGYSLYNGERRTECTIDGTHPNDVGAFRMADVIGGVLREVL